MKRVLLDCDGVLADFIGGVLPIVNRLCNREHRHEHVTAFDFCTSLGLSPDESATVKRAIGATQRFAADLAVLPGAREGVARLRELADVYIVTSPWNSNATWTSDREWWLKKHFDIPHRNVIHTSAKHVCVGDVFVDDKTEALERWQDEHEQGLAIRWITPHNRNEHWVGPDLESWDELVQLVALKPGKGRSP